MSATAEELFRQFKDDQLGHAEKAQLAENWLVENPNHPMASAIALLVKKDKELSDGSLEKLKKKFPVLYDLTNSMPHYPQKNHPHADVELFDGNGDLETVASTVLDEFPGVWGAEFIFEDKKNCDSEAMAVIRVVNLLESVLRGLNIDHFVEVTVNRTLAGTECDILLVYKPNRLPFAVLEVKKPANSAEGLQIIWEGKSNDGSMNKLNCVAGEIFDEMKAVQLFGFSTVTGMIATGNQWRIVGLSNLFGDSNVETILKNFQNFIEKEGKVWDQNTKSFGGSPGEQDISPCCDESTGTLPERKIWAGNIVPSHHEGDIDDLQESVQNSGTKIISQVVLFIAAACMGLSNLLQKNPGASFCDQINVGRKMPCRILRNPKPSEDQCRTFAFGTVNLDQLNLNVFNPKLGKIHVIRHLGMGDKGNVCLGASDKGSSCCAIKFYHEKNEQEESAEKEAKNWKAVYENDLKELPYVLRVAGGNCLVMPYFHPIQPQERAELLKQNVIRKSLLHFAESGFLHNDVKWRHFRWKKATIPGERKLFIIDLGEEGLEEHCNKEESIEAWVDQSLAKLQQPAKARPDHKRQAETPLTRAAKKRKSSKRRSSR